MMMMNRSSSIIHQHSFPTSRIIYGMVILAKYNINEEEDDDISNDDDVRALLVNNVRALLFAE